MSPWEQWYDWLRTQGIRRDIPLITLFREARFFFSVIDDTITPLNHLVHEIIGLLRASQSQTYARKHVRWNHLFQKRNSDMIGCALNVYGAIYH